MDGKKYILHAKKWDVYMNKKLLLIKGGYNVELLGSNRNNLLWEMVNGNVVEGPKYNY